MDYNTFMNLETAEIAHIVQTNGPKTCVFILNGTRRWFTMEHAQIGEISPQAYFNATSQRLLEIWQLLFDHGLETLLMPSLNPRILERSPEYLKMITQTFPRLTDHPRFLDFYSTRQVRVRFYGNYRDYFQGSAYRHIPDQFDQLTTRTAHYNKHRLFFGVCADDATDIISRLTIQYYKEHGFVPDKDKLTALYYGEYIPPSEIFISSGKPHTSDIPLMTTGKEQLYFSVAPSLYLDQPQFRQILYDYLYMRRSENRVDQQIQPENWEALRQFYQANLGKTLGIGRKHPNPEFWYPLPQVNMPDDFINELY